ncbi:hypothetical protein [Flavobacterium terrae]|uniref:Lipoprotein n=1 Tax=Flavobacterium terrae TaxID=415425 RepID=A0A1M6HGZ8_9FLAO|nr:hypothetical protein [Flavobacterium terrae]SHJ21414.1 hypothetical protein SAMN05444363_0006 [Flavobacterium terrae]
MKIIFLNKSLFIGFVLSILSLYSCHKEEKQLEIKESEVHACAKNLQPPPPIENKILSSAKIEINEEKRKYFVTVNLAADKLVDYNGKDQQLYKIETTNKNRTRKLYFALPIDYNKYWNEIKIFPDKENKVLEIGFKEKEITKTLYKLYAYKYYNEDFGDGHIVIKSNFEKYQYRTID